MRRFTLIQRIVAPAVLTAGLLSVAVPTVVTAAANPPAARALSAASAPAPCTATNTCTDDSSWGG